MSLKLQSQILTSLQLGAHTYHVLDIRVDVGGEDIPIFKDETGRLCVFSRLLSTVAGYKQKDTLYRMIQRQESLGILTEGFTHRMESAPEMHALCTRLALHFPILNGLLFRVRTPEALVYSQSFPLLQKLSQLDLRPVFATILEVEKALQTKSTVSADEALVDELASAFAETPPEPGVRSVDFGSGGHVAIRVEGTNGDNLVHPMFFQTEATSTETQEEKALDESGDVDRMELHVTWSQLPMPKSTEMKIPEPEAPLAAEEMEAAVRDLATSIDVPVAEKFLDCLIVKAPSSRKWKESDPELPPSQSIRDLISDEDIPQENAWVPPGYPEIYEDITGSWIGKVYAWVLKREADPHKRGMGANLPNLPLLLRILLRDCGFLEESGSPINDGKYFIFQEKTGSLQFNREILPKLICTFLATNPELDYREFLGKTTPVGLNVREIRELAQRLVKKL